MTIPVTMEPVAILLRGAKVDVIRMRRGRRADSAATTSMTRRLARTCLERLAVR